ncbi:MAG: nicotinamide-nucleotide amidohydrolase family protein [Rhizobiales bacterium]|nr:nicotinamide-nucleotide amidohydrolase family protein [Hyphomicrobiales bacterium]
MDDELMNAAREALDELRAFSFQAVTAESCTGGLIAAALTAIAGSSDVVDRAFVTYSNAAKSEMLGLPADLIATHGAVSEPVARAMAIGAIAHSHADVSVAVTGIAGPGGGTDTKPVGLVHLAASRRGGGTWHLERRYDPSAGRNAIRHMAALDALALLRETARR